MFESSIVNTGDFIRDAKESGKEGRETPTKRQCPHEESEGAEESECGKATHTRMRTDGEGPSPAGRPEQRDLANAHAVHG